MKVKQLIKKLQKLDQEADVIISSDEEGNSMGELYEVSEPIKYIVSEEWPHIEFLDDEDFDELSVEDKKDIKKKLKNGIILWPK